MPDFASLDPETRCYALVGQLLCKFTELETCLNAAIQAAMRVHDLMRFILCANLTLQQKVAVLRATLSVSDLPTTEYDYFKSTLDMISDKIIPKRNMIAHDFFQPDATGNGVQFLHVKAKSNFQLPSTIWSSTDFQDLGREIVRISTAVAKLRDALQGVNFDYNRVTRLVTVISPLNIPADAVLKIPGDTEPPRSGLISSSS